MCTDDDVRPLPASVAVMKSPSRLPASAVTATVIPYRLPNCWAKGSRILPRSASAQITKSALARTGTVLVVVAAAAGDDVARQLASTPDTTATDAKMDADANNGPARRAFIEFPSFWV